MLVYGRFSLYPYQGGTMKPPFCSVLGVWYGTNFGNMRGGDGRSQAHNKSARVMSAPEHGVIYKEIREMQKMGRKKGQWFFVLSTNSPKDGLRPSLGSLRHFLNFGTVFLTVVRMRKLRKAHCSPPLVGKDNSMVFTYHSVLFPATHDLRSFVA